MATVIGADRSAVAQWERGATIPEGMLREHLAALLDGRRWPALRAAMLGPDGDGLPATWARAAGVASAEGLLVHYRERDGGCALAIADRCGLGELSGEHLRRAEDAAYALRWLELAHELTFWLERSLVPQLPAGLWA